MKPQADRAREGRANPKGIPYLYVAKHRQTAISEVRPWLGSLVSVADFETVRDLVVLILATEEEPKRRPRGAIPDSERDAVVWSRIDDAFSEPVVPSDDLADYAPTQTIAEFFKLNGFDGISYRSAFGGLNIVIFDMAAVRLISCTLYQVTDIQISFGPSGKSHFHSDPSWMRVGIG